MRVDRSHSAFTLLELLIVIAVLAVVATFVFPLLGNDARLRVLAAADIVTSDIEFAQAMSVGDPSNPLVVRFDPAQARYWVAAASDPATPMTREDTGEPYLVTLGVGRAAPAENVTFTLSNITADTLEFDVYGTVVGDGTDPVVHLECDGETLDIIVSAATGSIGHN